MTDFLSEYYLIIRALHIISVITFMAGILYLPRLFVYHTRVERGSEADALFKTMERKLLRGIINPSMIAMFILGIMLVMTPGIISAQSGWFHVKILLVLIMAGMHGMMSRYRKQFEKGENTKSERYYRIFNEVPAVLMIVIVLLAVIKPF